VAASAALSLRLGTATNTKGRINNHEHIVGHGVPLSGYQRIFLLIRNPGMPPLSPPFAPSAAAAPNGIFCADS